MVKVVNGALSLEERPQGSVVTVGTFDGVHRGHQALVAAASSARGDRALEVVAYTFHPHPATLFAPTPPRMLMPLERRVEALGDLGVDRVVVEPFDRAFASVEADDWVERYLVEPLRPAHVVVGFNFTYGRGRGGDTEHLRALGARLGFEVQIVEPVRVGEHIVSSTEVRKALSAGDVALASALLGRPPAVVGAVVEGDKRGRTLGFPTANVAPEHDQLPAAGVYAGTLELLSGPEAGRRLPSVTNVGARPTFDGRGTRVEAHVLDASLDLYGLRVAVHLQSRLRDERSFEGPEALVRQIREDVEAARGYLNRVGVV